MRKTTPRVEAGFTPAVATQTITKLLQAWALTGGGTAGEHLRPPPRSQTSQALIEFALISPVLLLLLFGIIDVGRAVFYYDTLGHAAREGARAAVQAANRLPTNADVLTSVRSQMSGVPTSEPCPQGPISSATPPDNTAWLYVTEPNPPAPLESNPPMNAPGGEYPSAAGGGCSAINPASSNAPLQVTIRFNLILITPVIAQATANHIVITASAIFRTEY